MIAGVVSAGLWIIGGKRTEHSTALPINASPETVFAYLVEPEKLKDWVEGLSSVEKIEPNEVIKGMLLVDTTSRTMDYGGTSTVFEDEVLRFGENKNLTLRSTSSRVSLTWIFNLESKGDDSLLTYRVKVAHHGLGRFLAPLKKESMQERIDEEIRRLKELIEAAPAEAATPEKSAGESGKQL